LGFKILLRSGASDFAEMLASAFDESPYTLLSPGADALDWSDSDKVREYIGTNSPAIIVNYARPAKIADDTAELACLQAIAEACKADDIVLMHFSPYAVFGDVVAEDGLFEIDQPKPRDVLGKHLLACESACEAVPKHMVLRTGWMLGGAEHNLLDILIPKLTAGTPVFVSDHAFGRPISLQFVASMVYAMIQQVLCGAVNWGIFHVHGSDKCSEAEFCDNLVRLLKSEGIDTVDMPLVAGVDDDRRLMSGNALLSGERCTDNFGIQLPSWRNGLKRLIREYLDLHPDIVARTQSEDSPS